MIRKVKAEPMSGRRSAQGSVDDDDPSTLRRKKLSKPSSQLKGEVCGENCLVCNDRVFTRPLAEDLTEPENKLSYELREMFYEVYQIPCDEDFLKAKAIKNEFPLCYSCSFRLGQLKGLWERLKELHRDFLKFQETVAFSMVDIVAGAVPTRPLIDFENLKPEELTELLMKKERDTLQDYIYNEWHNKLPSLPDYETNSVPKIIPIVDAPPNVKGAVPGIVLAAPTVKPTIFTRPVLTKATIQKTSNGNGLNGKKVNMKLVTPPVSLGNDYDQEEIDEAHSDEVDDYAQYNQDYDIGDAPEEEPEIYEQGLEAFQHFASQGHFLGSTSGDWNGGEENEYTDYEQSLEDAEETGMNRRNSIAEMGDGLNSNNIEYQVNEEGLFVCMFCNKTFIHKYPYRDHLKTHTGEGPRCRLCGKIFPKNHNLMLHMRTHTGEKPFTCDICHKGFADKSNLKVHMRVHTGERPYKCDLCNLSFVNSSRLIVHRRMHTGEKPFICDTCQKCFSTSNQLASHKKSHMPMECSRPFSCMACGKGFSSEENLQNHILNCHPEIMEEN